MKVLIIYHQLYINLVILLKVWDVLGLKWEGCMFLFLSICVSVSMHLTACVLKSGFQVLWGAKST